MLIIPSLCINMLSSVSCAPLTQCGWLFADLSLTGNTSEIQEAFSEAASSHSVGSVEEDDDNDNMSDMISANVSGRGTPNISGRDTPLSQAGSVEEPPPPQMPLPEIPPLPETVPKPNREDVTDRFGKFEIRSEIESKDAYDCWHFRSTLLSV